MDRRQGGGGAVAGVARPRGDRGGQGRHAGLVADLTRRDPDAPAYDFVEEVHASRPVPRNPRAEKIILICWGLIAVKHVAVIWAVHHYAVPFHPLWINVPTFMLGLLATVAYYWRE